MWGFFLAISLYLERKYKRLNVHNKIHKSSCLNFSCGFFLISKKLQKNIQDRRGFKYTFNEKYDFSVNLVFNR